MRDDLCDVKVLDGRGAVGLDAGAGDGAAVLVGAKGVLAGADAGAVEKRVSII